MEDLRPGGIVPEVEAATAVADGLELQGVKDSGSREQAVVRLGRNHQLCSLWGHGVEKRQEVPEGISDDGRRRKEGDEEDVEFRRKRRNHNCFEAARAQRTCGGGKGTKKEGSSGHLANFILSTS